MGKNNLKAVWVSKEYYQFIRQISAYLNTSNKDIVEKAITDYASRHPELLALWDEFQTELKSKG